jgi:16S rRNA processing protein RimM
MPANDVWVVTTPSGKTIPLPVIDSVIVSVNLEQRVIVVRLLDGLETIDDHDASEHDA